MSFLNLRKSKKETSAPAKRPGQSEVATKKLTVIEGATRKTSKNVRPEVLRRPHITEKAAGGAERGVYVFEVSTTANKREIAEAVSLFYNVTPIKVRVVAIPSKRITVKGRIGFRKGGKKAYVYLKPGQRIENI